MNYLLDYKLLNYTCDIYRVKNCPTTFSFTEEQKRLRPKRIILVRHGQSTANASNYTELLTIPDNKIQLTEKGYKQALKVGQELKKIIGNESFRAYVSPYMRTKQTFNAIMESLGKTIINILMILESENRNMATYSQKWINNLNYKKK